MTKPEEKEKELKEWLEANGYTEDHLELMLPFMRQDAGKFVQQVIEAKLTEEDIDAVETSALQNDLDEVQTAKMYIDYFQDKYKISTEDIMVDYYNTFLDTLKSQLKFFTSLLDRISKMPKEDVENEFKAYLEKVDEMNLRKITKYVNG